MATEPPDEDPEPTPEDAFLSTLWDHLEAALDTAISADVMTRLDEVLTHCAAAAELIQRWQSRLGDELG